MNKLLKCAKKVLDRYDGDGVISYLQDSDIMEPLRQAVKEAALDEIAQLSQDLGLYDDHIPDTSKMVYKPMTDDEFQAHYNSMPNRLYQDKWFYERLMERAVIERLGLVWGEK